MARTPTKNVRLPDVLVDRVEAFIEDNTDGFRTVPEVIVTAVRAFLGDDHQDLPVTRKELRGILALARDATGDDPAIKALHASARQILPDDGGH